MKATNRRHFIQRTTLAAEQSAWRARRNQAAAQVWKKPPTTDVKDVRRVFEDESMDAVFIATSNHWQNIAHVNPSSPPRELDYDLWVGPASMVPYQTNLLHGSWRWFLPFGAGDAGNDGVHDN